MKFIEGGICASKGFKASGTYCGIKKPANDDPNVNPDAKKIDKMSYDDILKNELKVMDTSACALCKQNKIPIIVFDFKAKGSLVQIMDGKAVGTFIS